MISGTATGLSVTQPLVGEITPQTPAMQQPGRSSCMPIAMPLYDGQLESGNEHWVVMPMTALRTPH